jgi:hypothetical protein
MQQGSPEGEAKKSFHMEGGPKIKPYQTHWLRRGIIQK